ncbi:Cytochrome c4 [Cupriavidus basilensis]|uniref:Cytochrome c4 n=2 Tax=Cupriavidus basilensis TaxID=68895 RepID=A0A0C4YNE8_9BURK|nr:Cytochrome c4 [Cupriavidus basilensis]
MKMTLTIRVPLIALLTFTGMGMTIIQAYGEDGAKLAAQLCATCHGIHGRSESPMFPRLDAQTPEYLEAQLKGFREHARGETEARSFMWGIASQLDDATVRSLAEYYAGQTAAPGAAGDTALMSKGQTIFEHGAPDDGVPACASCHGALGQGAAQFPRLAGQHKSYLLRQIEAFRDKSRGNAPVMSAVAHNLNTDQANAVATYLQSR